MKINRFEDIKPSEGQLCLVKRKKVVLFATYSRRASPWHGGSTDYWIVPRITGGLEGRLEHQGVQTSPNDLWFSPFEMPAEFEPQLIES